MQTDTLKDSIIAALRVFVRQRPGLEFGNYGNPVAYRAEIRRIGRALRDAETLLHRVELAHGISGQDMLRTAAHSRLKIRNTDSGVTVDYITGQYFPTEYRPAVARLCAELLWTYRREHAMPEAVGGAPIENKGEWLRQSFRREYGRSLAGRYFN